ncbi:hypothetical protein [Streptomyces sp. NPDC006335]|uniref:hypothetical protein n=1 Tax=Streptomyces sp. NPDC006335 TaxID=3156895 RepID=UPI0033A8AB2F
MVSRCCPGWQARTSQSRSASSPATRPLCIARRLADDNRIDLRIAPALQTLCALSPEPVIDIAFIGTDKDNYLAYFEEVVHRLRPG